MSANSYQMPALTQGSNCAKFMIPHNLRHIHLLMHLFISFNSQNKPRRQVLKTSPHLITRDKVTCPGHTLPSNKNYYVIVVIFLSRLENQSDYENRQQEHAVKRNYITLQIYSSTHIPDDHLGFSVMLLIPLIFPELLTTSSPDICMGPSRNKTIQFLAREPNCSMGTLTFFQLSFAFG